MRRIIVLLTVALVMVAMMAMTIAPAFAKAPFPHPSCKAFEASNQHAPRCPGEE